MVPKILHFVWLGEANPLADYCQKTVTDLHPDYDIRVWRQKPHKWPELFEKAWNKAGNRLAQQADVLRVWGLWKYGGVYMDSDFIGIRPLKEEWLKCRFRCAEHWRKGIDFGRKKLANGVMISQKEATELAIIIMGWDKIKQVEWESFGGYRLYEVSKLCKMNPLPAKAFFPNIDEDTALGKDREELAEEYSDTHFIHLWKAGRYG